VEIEMTEFEGNRPKRRLMRRPDEGKLGGVCAGMAEYFDVDVVLVRAAWVVLSIWPGAIVFGLIAYVAAWVLMPRAETAPGTPAPRARLLRSRTDRRIAGVCGGLAEYFDVDPTVVRVSWVIVSILCGAVVFGVIAYLVAWFIIPTAPAAALHPSPSVP
jgi:phage shock protein PspC (stress-responsive transcriptional regulator)